MTSLRQKRKKQFKRLAKMDFIGSEFILIKKIKKLPRCFKRSWNEDGFKKPKVKDDE